LGNIRPNFHVYQNYTQENIKLLGHILRLDSNDPIKQTIIEPDPAILPMIHYHTRRGREREN